MNEKESNEEKTCNQSVDQVQQKGETIKQADCMLEASPKNGYTLTMSWEVRP